MRGIYTPKYFAIHELVPKDYFTGPENLSLIDPIILYIADELRGRYGKMVCNTWYWGGGHQYRGWRPLDCPVGSEKSMHKYGLAIDLIPVETTAQAIRYDIFKNQKDNIFRLINRVESNVSWLHIDRKPTEQFGVNFFNP